MKRRLLTLCLFLFLTTVQALAQKTVTGKVADDETHPLAGASVQVKGTNAGVTTDNDGNYSIKVNKGQTLVVSFKGTVTEERVVGNASRLNFFLKKATTALDQVVVVGYGSQRKADLTGAVGTIDVQKTIGSRPVPDLARGLQGSSPGLL
ncbi:MAG TPA: carboxypeptidase-like regulatory domain-containing protein, partial [Puia sp.]|nr:carboxypeptidase-like regulatory domain-containing protein [Puia sp.]